MSLPQAKNIVNTWNAIDLPQAFSPLVKEAS